MINLPSLITVLYYMYKFIDDDLIGTVKKGAVSEINTPSKYNSVQKNCCSSRADPYPPAADR